MKRTYTKMNMRNLLILTVVVGSLTMFFQGAHAQVTVTNTVTIGLDCGILLNLGNSINYGTIYRQGEESVEKKLTITNAGRATMAVVTKGTAWTDNGNQMNVGDTRFSTTSGSYASKTPLTASDQSLVSVGNGLLSVGIQDTFWQLKPTFLNPAYTGSPSQTVTLTGSC